ncbi:MAG: ABC transporter ATP-binding protein [Oscillospiraceae bacterium]
MARNKYDIDETLESPFNLQHLKRSFVYIRRHGREMILALVLSIISALCALVAPLFTEHVLDVTVPNKDTKELALISLVLVVLLVAQVLLATWRGRIMTRVGQSIVHDIRYDLFEHLQQLSFQYYDSRPHGKILVRVVHYVNNVSDMLSNGIINFILEIVNLIFITIFMFTVNVRLSLVVLAGLPLLAVIMCILGPKQRRAWQAFSNKNSNLTAYLNESISGMRVTQIFTREEENEKIFTKLSVDCNKTFMRAAMVSNLVWFSVDNISQIISAVIYLTGALWMGAAGMVSFGTLVVMGNYSWRFWQPILNLSNLYNNLINTIAYLERIFETIDEPVSIQNAPDAYELPPIEGAVTFDDVVFEYEPDTPVLEHVSFTVAPGESVALVGPTGAGKTTVVNLISRFYDLKSGRVLIDGHDISKVTLRSLRSQMGIMLQDSFVFSGTIESNIKYGKLDATHDEVERAARMVRADEFINTMEKGYQTEMGERGSRLSQGEKQLLSFARTLISDPRILILDEATSSIDTKTERLVQDALQKMLRGRTSFIIAHRLSTIKSCDRIMYVADKRIVECGTHDELMRKRGEYYKLYTAQIAEA